MIDTAFQKYMLMHKDIAVAEIELDEATSAITKIGEIFFADHLPVGIAVKKGGADRLALNEWWEGRAIPASRDGIKNALQELNLSSAKRLLEKCLGLSLSDQYWIRPEKSNIHWADVNFFENPFSEDVGNILLGKQVAVSYKAKNEQISLMSPDNTSDGWLRKKWKIIEGKRCLMKGGSGATQQEPYNEVFASRIMERLGIPYVSYTLMIQDDYPFSVCEDFITPQTELISAWYMMQTRRKENHVSIYQHYLNCCEALGISNVTESIDKMIVLDYLIANEDRHQNNFGAVRNAETLKWIGAAPIYDSGTSLWFDKPTAMIRADGKLTCKPFKNSHDEQIKLVSSFHWLDLSMLQDVDEDFRELVKGSLFIDDARCDAICHALKKRVQMLTEIVKTRSSSFTADDRSADVETNIAYSGKQE